MSSPPPPQPPDDAVMPSETGAGTSTGAGALDAPTSPNSAAASSEGAARTNNDNAAITTSALPSTPPTASSSALPSSPTLPAATGPTTAPAPGTPSAPAPPGAAPTSPNQRRRAPQRPLSSVSFFLPFGGQQTGPDGPQVGLTWTLEVFGNDGEGAAAGLGEPANASGGEANAAPNGEQRAEQAGAGPAGAPIPPTGAEGQSANPNPNSIANPNPDQNQEGPRPGEGATRSIFFIVGPDGTMRRGGDANVDDAAAPPFPFAFPFPFPFAPGPPPPDPAKAAELLDSLPTVGRALLKRVDKIVAAEDAQRGDSDSSGWQCGVCLEGLDVGETVKALPCNHLFHEACLQPWFTNHHHTCPTCRLDLDPLRTLHEPARRAPLRPTTTGSGRGTPGARAAHPYARPAAGANAEGRRSRPGSNAPTQPGTPQNEPSEGATAAGDRLEVPTNPLDAMFDLARMFGMTTSPAPMREGDQQAEGEGEGEGEGQRANPPTAPSAEQPGEATAAAFNLAASAAEQPGTPAADGLARPTPERRRHITIFHIDGGGMHEHHEHHPAPASPGAGGAGATGSSGPAEGAGDAREATPATAPQTADDALPNAGPGPGSGPLPWIPLSAMGRPLFRPPGANNAAASGAATPNPPGNETPAAIPTATPAVTNGYGMPNGAGGPGALPPFPNLGVPGMPGLAEIANLLNQPNPAAPPPGDAPAGPGAPGPGAPPGTPPGPDANTNGQVMRFPFEFFFLRPPPGPGPGPGPGAPPPPEPENQAPVQQQERTFVPQTLESWTAQREKTLGWRCDAVECLIAPPVPDADTMDVDADDDEDTTDAGDKEMLAIYSESQAPFPPRDDDKEPHTGHEFVLLACPHRWHRACLETAARSAGHSTVPDESGREWIRCARCRKEGWIVPRDAAAAAAVATPAL